MDMVAVAVVLCKLTMTKGDSPQSCMYNTLVQVGDRNSNDHVSVLQQETTSLLHSADLCPSHLVKFIFRQSSLCSFTFCGYNSLYGQRYLKCCDTQYAMCADVIRIIRLSGHSNADFEYIIRTISCD